MRNNAPVEHCVAEAFILHREIVLTMKPDFTLRAYLTTEVNEHCAMKNKNGYAAARTAALKGVICRLEKS